VVGGPKTGKTTTAPTAKHTDDTIGLGWDGAKKEVVKWFGGAQEVEGVLAARALRQWLRDNPTGKPCDEVLHLVVPKAEQTPGQQAMQRGVETVFREIRPELERRGVKIVDELP
jgi:hypothetical protein